MNTNESITYMFDVSHAHYLLRIHNSVRHFYATQESSASFMFGIRGSKCYWCRPKPPTVANMHTYLIMKYKYVPMDKCSKEVWKSNFRQYGQMEKQRWEESERRRAEETRPEKEWVREKAAMICGSGWSKSRLAKAAGAEPYGQVGDKKLHAVVARSTCPSQNVRSTSFGQFLNFWKSWDVEKVRAVVTRSTFPSQNVKNTTCSDQVQMSFRVAGARDSLHPAKSQQNVRVL